MLADKLVDQYGVSIVIVGNKAESEISKRIINEMKYRAVDLCGKINLIQLSYLIKDSALTVSNDSASVHLASYLDVPVVSLYGPSNPKEYGPWGKKSIFLKGDNGDINNISCEDVMSAVNDFKGKGVF